MSISTTIFRSCALVCNSGCLISVNDILGRQYNRFIGLYYNNNVYINYSILLGENQWRQEWRHSHVRSHAQNAALWLVGEKRRRRFVCNNSTRQDAVDKPMSGLANNRFRASIPRQRWRNLPLSFPLPLCPLPLFSRSPGITRGNLELKMLVGEF